MAINAYEYNGDRAAMEKLGLETQHFKEDWKVLGTVTLEAGTIVVEVRAEKSDDMFWRFTMQRSGEDRVVEMSTGSGTFRDYYRTAEQWINGGLRFTIRESDRMAKADG